MRIAVAGGTGLTGRHVVDRLGSQGHQPVVLARSAGVDLVAGTGIDDALAGVDAVIDVSNIVTQSRPKAVEFFETAGRNLTAAASRAGVRHLVTLSIIGIDDVDTGYYAGKRAQERIARESGVPWTILRAAQFHEFTDQLLGLVPGPIAVIPTMLSQPIAVAEVADALISAATSEPVGMAPELAGPRPRHQPELARRLLRARGSRRLVVPIPMPGAAGRGMRDGKLLPQGDGPRGIQTFEEWLTQQGS
ncbi:SDR family oxidoreductase [Gordonia soli]|uniref:NAD(P)-binding domain-containing protein n=1 Tax=Gordonia soli NBRC 108243 TaxID=1223545 RepID=M0QJY3_9ACTN|nr:NAD(P)H-binding protein [Gordonia soli]GAC68601.1 hypothetical protein GS4_16_01320 [Gordonia soli NBRC 108243]